jgi:hypothetical protein
MHGVTGTNVYEFFSFNNQPDALIIQIYSVIKLYMFRASPLSSGVLYCTFGTGNFHAGFDDRFQTESGWNGSSILTLHQNLHENHQCRMYSKKLLMVGK